MEENMNNNLDDGESQFCQIVIRDSTHLTGASLIKALELVLKHVLAQWVVVQNLECGGEARVELMSENLSKGIAVRELLIKATGIDQFDWGYFFLFEDEQKATAISLPQPPSEKFQSLVRQSLTTLGAVDSNYFYIYTRNASLVNAVANTYANCEVKRGRLENLNFPW